MGAPFQFNEINVGRPSSSQGSPRGAAPLAANTDRFVGGLPRRFVDPRSGGANSGYGDPGRHPLIFRFSPGQTGISPALRQETSTSSPRQTAWALR
jgi:hypothetical protein